MTNLFKKPENHDICSIFPPKYREKQIFHENWALLAFEDHEFLAT